MKTENNGHITHDSRQPRHESLRRLAAAAAVLVLMVCSFGAGAIFFPRETIVEVPAEQETIALDGTGLTLILPDEWKGKYGWNGAGMERSARYMSRISTTETDSGPAWDTYSGS